MRVFVAARNRISEGRVRIHVLQLQRETPAYSDPPLILSRRIKAIYIIHRAKRNHMDQYIPT